MALTVLNNTAAAMTLGELNKNVSNLGRQLKKVATGTKITGAGDGAAEYNIAEKMQVQLRSLAQDIENTRTGRSILKVAEGGIQGIVDELRDMKQLAINAANDTNTDADRAAIQKEFDEKLRQIDDIVATTNYNGKLLLDGTYAKRMNVSISQNPTAVYGSRGASATAVVASGLPAENWTGGNISYGGAYTIPDGWTGTINISSVAAAGGVQLSQAGAQLSEVTIVVDAPADGSAKLWIDNLNITNSTAGNIIKFAGNDNVLTLIGDNTLEVSAVNNNYAVVNMGGGLEVQGNGSTLTINNYMDMANGQRSGQGACIGTDGGSNTSGNISIINGTFNLHSVQGASIGSGAGGSTIGDISIANATVNVTGNFFAGIGSGVGSACGNILVSHSTITDLPNLPMSPDGVHGSIDTCIGSGYSNANCGNIFIDSCVVNASNRDSPIIGAGNNSTCKDIKVSNSEITSFSDSGAGIGSGIGGHAGNVEVINATKLKHTSSAGAAIGSGLRGSVGRITVDYTTYDLLDASGAWTEGHEYPGIGPGKNGLAEDIGGIMLIPPTPTTLEGTPLMIHTGTKANQRINCYIENLGAKALFDVETDEELEDLANVRTRAAAQRLLGSIINPNVNGPLDKAINYALGEITQVGAYINRLEHTEDTLTVSHENTTSSESVIRDADMAKEMTEYTKSNILSQAAQSMLAQANQNSSSVLSLLQ